MSNPYAEHHWRRNWFFYRDGAGSVHIVKRSGKSVTASATIPAAEWASIIAHVSMGGETAENYSLAEGFHAGMVGLHLATPDERPSGLRCPDCAPPDEAREKERR